MNKIYMLDTNICSFIMREQHEAVLKRFEQAVLRGNRIALDATTEIKVAMRMAGTAIGPNDTAIARHVIAAGAVLVSNNVREFKRVLGMVLENWVKLATLSVW